MLHVLLKYVFPFRGLVNYYSLRLKHDDDTELPQASTSTVWENDFPQLSMPTPTSETLHSTSSGSTSSSWYHDQLPLEPPHLAGSARSSSSVPIKLEEQPPRWWPSPVASNISTPLPSSLFCTVSRSFSEEPVSPMASNSYPKIEVLTHYPPASSITCLLNFTPDLAGMFKDPETDASRRACSRKGVLSSYIQLTSLSKADVTVCPIAVSRHVVQAVDLRTGHPLGFPFRKSQLCRLVDYTFKRCCFCTSSLLSACFTMLIT